MPDDTPALLRQIEKLRKINASLVSRLERTHEREPSAFGLFENAVTVERQVRHKTEDLRQALHALERSNDALQQAKQIAEAANALKTAFLASVSHDLLQPLHAARLALSVLGEITTETPGTQLVGQADRSLGTLEEILKTLLDLSKLDAGVLKPDIRGVAIAGLIEGLYAEFAPIAANRGLVLRQRGKAPPLLTDPLMLRRILQNLLSNAIRYTRQGGVLLCLVTRDHVLQIDVTDTGPGVRPDRREAIFEEFQRDDPGTGHEPGFGLGLAIVRRLAQSMGHEIKLWSRPGFGSVFSIIIPLAGDWDLQPASNDSAHPPFEHVQVLWLAEHHSAYADVSPQLAAWGCELAHAASMEDVLSHFAHAERIPDILIAGFLNPAMSSEMIESTRGKAGSKIPAFVITESGESLETGIDVLHRPLKPAELRALIAHLLASDV